LHFHISQGKCVVLRTWVHFCRNRTCL